MVIFRSKYYLPIPLAVDGDVEGEERLADVLYDAGILGLVLHFRPRSGERVHLGGKRADTVGGGDAEVGTFYIIGLEGVSIGGCG